MNFVNEYNFIKGIHIGKPPFGYSKDYKGELIQDSNIEIVEKIFKLRIDGFGYFKIAKELDLFDDKKLPRTMFIKTIITNPVYAGFVRYKNKIKVGKHEGIVTKEIFLKANNDADIDDFTLSK